MSDGSPLLRQWMLLSALSSREAGAHVSELAVEHGVNEKTIRRDLLTLRRVGFPLEESRGNFGRKTWRLSHSNGAPPVLSFNWQEAVSLWLARRFFEPLAGTQFWTAANQAFGKIRATLGDGPLRYIDRMAGAFHLTAARAGYSPEQAQALDRLTQAIEERRVVLMGYKSERTTEPATREVHPYGLAFHNGATYLVAFATEHQQVRTYKLDRVDYVELHDLRFPAPSNFSLQDYFAGSLGVYRGPGQPDGANEVRAEVIEVRVKFLPKVAQYAHEKRWHASQTLTPQRDGSVLAEFRLSTTAEIKRLLLSFGENAIVLEPATLRAEMAATFKAALAHYSSSPSRKKPSNSRRKPQ